MMKRTGMLLAVTAILASMIVPSVIACTTFTPGYWKNHDWGEVDEITIGAGDEWLVTEAETLDKEGILWASPRGGNAWIILAQKVIAAKLSMVNSDAPGDWDYPGNFPGTDTMVDLVADADEWLSNHPGEECFGGRNGCPDRAEGLELAAKIDYYLNWYDGGNLTPPPPYPG